MKIAIIGYGKMGRRIQSIALEKKHNVVTIDPHAIDANYKEINAASLNGIDVAIEFTRPDAVLSNVRQLIDLKVPVVVGTTGWDSNLNEVQKWVLEKGSRLIYGSNYSIGMNITFQLAQEAARRFSAIQNYEMAGLEIHHSKKQDSPSGTALEISRRVENEYSQRGNSNKMKFESLRVGHEPGTHTMIWDSTVDTIELTHRARSRDGFAEGALIAADWLCKQSSGFYSFANCLEGILK